VGASQPAGVVFNNVGGGVYTLTGSAADVTSELDALTLTAPTTWTGAVNNIEALTFSLSDKSSANATAATDTVTADILGPNYTKTFGYSGHIETFTVQTSGYYNIVADGAQRGGGVNNSRGGLGAIAGGDIYLKAGATLEIVVGGEGQNGQSQGAGGGGGGSFVIEINDGSSAVDINEVIAGGGGGGDGSGYGSDYGQGGRTQATGGSGGGSGGAGGVNGAAGIGSTDVNGPGGGGGGFTGGAAGQNGSVNGVTFAGGAAGVGQGRYSGGGYPVGASAGGGGGSLVNSTLDISKTAGAQSGNGSISITAVQLPPTITGGSTTDASPGSTTDTPFAGVTIGDVNPGATETLTITLSDPNASLSVGASHPA